MLRRSSSAFLLASAIAFSGCGSDTIVDPPPPTPPPAPVQETIVIFGDNGGVPPDTAIGIDFSIPSAGTVAATVDWTFPSSQVWVAMTTTACQDFVAAFLGQCFQIGTPNNGNQKPKTATGSVTQGGSGRLWIANFATVDESMAVQITLTRTRTASAPVLLESVSRTWVPVSGSAKQALRGFEVKN